MICCWRKIGPHHLRQRNKWRNLKTNTFYCLPNPFIVSFWNQTRFKLISGVNVFWNVWESSIPRCSSRLEIQGGWYFCDCKWHLNLLCFSVRTLRWILIDYYVAIAVTLIAFCTHCMRLSSLQWENFDLVAEALCEWTFGKQIGAVVVACFSLLHTNLFRHQHGLLITAGHTDSDIDKKLVPNL